MGVVCMKPRARPGIVSTDECVERPEEPQEKEGELAFLSLRIEAASTSQARNRRFTRPDYLGEMPVSKAQSRCGVDRRLGEDGLSIRRNEGV